METPVYISTKILWQLITGKGVRPSEELLIYHLKAAHEQIILGLDYYKIELEGVPELVNRLNKNGLNFFNKLQKFIGIDSFKLTYLFEEYLLHEFRGSEECFNDFLSSDKQMTVLMYDLWFYYYTERLFLLKCINFILEKREETSDPLNQYFIKIFPLSDDKIIFDSMISQLKNLYKCSLPNIETHGDMMKTEYQKIWIEKHLMEQLEVCHNLLIFVEHTETNAKDFLTILEIFFNHRFGACQEYYFAKKNFHNDLIKRIEHMQLILLFTLLDIETIQDNIAQYNEEISSKIENILNVHKSHQYSGPLFLAWMIVLLNKDENENSFHTYSILGFRALELEVFNYLLDVINNPMFKNDSKCGIIAHLRVYELIETFISKFNAENFNCFNGIFELSSELLKQPYIASRYWLLSPNEGFRMVTQRAIELFPIEFNKFGNIILSLLISNGDNIDKIIDEITSLSSFSQYYFNLPAEQRFLFNNNVRSVQLRRGYQPFSYSNFTLKLSTSGSLVEDKNPFVKWHTPFSFFIAADCEFNEYIYQASSGVANIRKTTYDNVILSFKIFNKIIDIIDCVPKYLEFMLDHLFNFIERYCGCENVKNSELFSICLETLKILININPESGLVRLYNLNLFPYIDSKGKDPYMMVTGNTYNPREIGIYLATFEKNNKEYPLIIAYLEFLNSLLMLDEDNDINENTYNSIHNHFLIPGLLFISKEIFPFYLNWEYKNPDDIDQIGLLCLKIYHFVVREKPKVLEYYSPLQQLNIIALINLVNGEAGVTLFNILAKGNSYIDSIMHYQTSWITGRGYTYMYIIQLTFSILNRVMLYKDEFKKNPLCLSTCKENNLQSKFKKETTNSHGQPISNIDQPNENQFILKSTTPLHIEDYFIYHHNLNSKLKIVNCIADYMHCVYNARIRILAVKILCRFAQFNLSLMACWRIDADFIRHKFLNFLEDKTESKVFKVAILEFIDITIKTQPSLAEAFCNITYPKRLTNNSRRKAESIGGCLNFVFSVISDAREKPSMINGMIHESVINIIHTIWFSKSESLKSFLRSKEFFWESIFQVLYSKPCDNINSYSQVFDIINLELFVYQVSIPKQFEEILAKFLDSDHITKWSSYITSSELVGNVDKPISLVKLIVSWDQFWRNSVRKLPFRIELEYKLRIVDDIFRVINNHFDSIKDDVLEHFASLGSVILIEWDIQNHEDLKKIIRNLASIMRQLAQNYIYLQTKKIESLLTFIISSLKVLMWIITSETEVYLSLMESCLNIIKEEFNFLFPPLQLNGSKLRKHDVLSKSDSVRCSLSLTILIKLLKTLPVRSGVTQLIKQSKIIKELIEVTRQSLHNPSFFMVSLMCFDCLNVIANSELCHILSIYNFPQNIAFDIMPQRRDGKWVTTKWSVLYNCTISIFIKLIQKTEMLYLNQVLSFIAVHQDAIISPLIMLQYTLKPEVLNLAISVLMLIRELSKYKFHWRLDSSRTNLYLTKSVLSCLEICISLLNYPETLYNTLNVQFENVSDFEGDEIPQEIIYTKNKLLDISGLCLYVLHYYSPTFTYLLNEIHLEPVATKPILDLDFSLIKVLPLSVDDLLSGKIAFGPIITLINMCTLLLSKGTCNMASRKSHSPLGSGRNSYFGLNPQIITPQSKTSVMLTLEFAITLVISQGIHHIMIDQYDKRERQLIRRELSSEFTLFTEYVKRNIKDQPKDTILRVDKLKFGNRVTKKLTFSIENIEETTSRNLKPLSRIPNKILYLKLMHHLINNIFS